MFDGNAIPSTRETELCNEAVWVTRLVSSGGEAQNSAVTEEEEHTQNLRATPPPMLKDEQLII